MPTALYMNYKLKAHIVMKSRNFLSTARLSLSACMILLCAIFLNSCKEKATDASDLLSTVPSSASAVVGLNLNSLLEKAGCTVKDSKITPGKDLSECLNSIPEEDGLKLLLSGESGIDPSGAILFADAYNVYITAALSDTAGFMDLVTKHNGQEFSETDGVKTNGDVAIIGAQVWVALNGSLDPKAVKNYSKLEETQSFAVNPFAKNISEMTHDVTAWIQTNMLMTRGMLYANTTALAMVMNATFEGASAISFNLDFKKGLAEAESVMLNDKGEPAKYLFPADKIDVDLVKSLGKDANTIGAISITKEMVDKVKKFSSSLGGNLLGNYMTLLSPIDGTVALALSDAADIEAGVSGAVTTDGNPSLDFMQLLSLFGPTRKDGKVVRISKGSLKGNLDIEEYAAKMKGATFGMAISIDETNSVFYNAGFKSMILTAASEQSGLKFKGVVESTDPSENALLTIIKKANAANKK